MKTTKEMIEVMQAFEDGEQIEVLQTDECNWRCSDGPSWDWWECDYRIKHKPREVWIDVCEDGRCGFAYKTKEDTEYQKAYAGKPIKFREVMEDES